MKPMRTATPVLHDVWTMLDSLRPPPACRMQRSFERHMDTKIRCVPLRWTGSSSLPVSHDPFDSEIAGEVWTAVHSSADCLADSTDCLS